MRRLASPPEEAPRGGSEQPRPVGRAALIPVALLVAAPLGAQLPSPPAGSSDQIADGRDLPVRELVLGNGMHFLLLERAGAPTVSFVTHVSVGSVHETAGRTGISHFLEHLLFKGTTTIGTTDVEAERALFDAMDSVHDSIVRAGGGPTLSPATVARLEGRLEALEDSARAYVVPNEYGRILAANGARGPNATTSYEATTYSVSLPSNRAELWFAMEADRMRNPVLREFFAERRVIMEERRLRLDTSPAGLLSAAHHRAAFIDHPYGTPPIGHRMDLLRLSRSDVEEYYERHYGPERTTVAIVGHFEPDSVAVWAERYFSSIERRAFPAPVPPTEPVQREERRVEVHHDAAPQIRIGWKVPSGVEPEGPVLQVLASVLVGATDARLHRRLVRDDRIAASVFAGTGPGRLYPGLFTIQAAPLAPHTPEEVERVIYEELDRLRRDPPTEEEITRVRTSLLAAEVRRLASSQGLAFQLASSQAMWGDWRETFRSQARMREVGTEDVLRVLDEYFRAEGRTVGILRPAPER